nr:hypothetical protein BaRGS_010643 [Batillaria attramentaria]
MSESSGNSVSATVLATTTPTAGATLADIERIIQRSIDGQTRAINSRLDVLRAEVSGVVESVQAIANDILDLKGRTQSLETTCTKIAEKHDDLAESVDDLQEDLRELQARYEEEIDKLEAFSRRDNLRFFGVPETPGETFDSCAEKVVQCLQGTVPSKTWSVDDEVRAHRLGKPKASFAATAASRDSKPRPIIVVKFTRWRDKMAILTKGRPALKQKGIGVSGDLTSRQREKIQQKRDQGFHAYYKGNELVVAGPLRQRNASDTDNFGRRREHRSGTSGSGSQPPHTPTTHRTGLDRDDSAARDTLSLPSPHPPKRRRRQTQSPRTPADDEMTGDDA